ncbi:MAG: hypothetical protein ACJ71Y_13805 [Blastococcus sp.]
MSAALDNNFVAALGTLGLTPATLGNATLADGSVSFPITGGTLTVFDKSSGYRPYVQGTLLHQNSGLSLTAGGTTVELTDFTVDPGTPARLFGDVAVNGQQAAASAPLFDLDGTTLNPISMDSSGNAVLQAPRRAQPRGRRSTQQDLRRGLVIGIATITVPTS